MKKYAMLIYKIFACILVVGLLVSFSVFLVKKDEIVTKNITLKYFENSMNDYDASNLKEFVAKSENDILYKNAIMVYDVHHYSGVSDYYFKIDKYEVFGSGKYQCYFNYNNIPTCDLEHEGKYFNYLIDATITYKTNTGNQINKKEKGLVVFVKDGSNGNIFEWKLVRYNSYEVE